MNTAALLRVERSDHTDRAAGTVGFELFRRHAVVGMGALKALRVLRNLLVKVTENMYGQCAGRITST